MLSLLLVTHDRAFLERTCGEILELDNAAVYSYQTEGSYETFLRRRAERIAADDADLGRQQELQLLQSPRAVAEDRQTLEGSFSDVSNPNFASKDAFESSRRDLHNSSSRSCSI